MPLQKHLRTPDIVIGADTIVVRGLICLIIVLIYDKCRKYLGLKLENDCCWKVMPEV